MIAPYMGQKAYTGIYTDNVYNLTIGNTTGNNNVFDNLFCGIQSYNSYLTVVKNTFQNINKVPLCTPGEITDYSPLYCETGIHIAKKTTNLSNPLLPTVTIGGSTTSEANNFTNCDLAYNSFFAKQIIKNNTVTSSKTGFSCRDVVPGSVISNNTLTSTYSNIYILSSTPAPRGITIESNTLNSVGMYGIRILNCQSQGLSRTKILTNPISYNAAVGNGKGIYAVNCNNITIQGNTISSATAVSSGFRKIMRGINIENSPGGLVKSNIINNLGTGIYAEGMLSLTQFQCNTLYQNYYGFFMPNGLAVATVYENQGTSTIPNDNQWTADHPSPATGIPTYRITGDAIPSIAFKNWYYRAGTNSYFPNVVSPNPATSFVAMFQLPSNSPSPCGSKGGDDENIANTDSTSAMETIIPDNANLAVQMRYLYMSMLYNSNAEQFANEIGQDEESLYSNIPLIAKINELTQADTTINKAIALNNTLKPANEMEQYRKFVNSVYLEYVAKSITPSTELIDELYSIANMAPNVSGEAVYIARAILNYNPESAQRKNIEIQHGITPESENIQYFPNPANDVLNITSVYDFTSDSKIELYDITGRLVYSSSIGIETNNVTISLKDVKQGLYLCIIKNSKEVISSFKVSIVKQ
jgi:parallel beta-helix repeat protein